VKQTVVNDRLHPRPTHHARYALRSLAAALRRSIAAIDELGSVVDFGCGDQPYRPLFDGRCRSYLGADLPGSRSAELHISAAGTLPLDDASVDTVFSTQVLEHVPDPLAYLAEARRVLRPGGNLLLSTHGVWTYHPHPDDFWRWTSAGLTRLLEQAGFEIRCSDGVLGAASAGLQLWQDALLRRMPEALRSSFVLLVQPAVALSDRTVSAATRSRDAAIYVIRAVRPQAS
jgi:SAM-dependent methyltransferase